MFGFGGKHALRLYGLAGDGRFVRNPTFKSLRRISSWGSTVQVADDWFAEFKPGSEVANHTLGPAEGGGLALHWEAPAKRVRIWQPLDANLIAARRPRRDYTVALTLSSNTPARDIIDWIAILEEAEDGDVRFHTKLRHSIAERACRYCFTGFAANVSLSRGRKYRLCAQFGVKPKDVVLHSIQGTADAGRPDPAQLTRAHSIGATQPQAPSSGYPIRTIAGRSQDDVTSVPPASGSREDAYELEFD